MKQEIDSCCPKQKREYCSGWNQHNYQALTYFISFAKPRVLTARYRCRTWLYLMEYKNKSPEKKEEEEEEKEDSEWNKKDIAGDSLGVAGCPVATY